MSFFFPGLRPETTSEDIFSACRDGDEFFCKEWTLSPEHDLNQRWRDGEGGREREREREFTDKLCIESSQISYVLRLKQN